MTTDKNISPLPAPIDVTDPWRGLYQATRLPAPTEYGDIAHPDIPCWPDDREDALDKLVHAQGFDFQIVAGEFTEAALEEGDELYWAEMRAWTPVAPPEGEWRLAWKGDTEDGPYAWFVRPMALRPEPVALTATGKQQVGEVQGDALDVEWLKERISSIHSTVSLGHQTGPHAYAGEDFGRYLAEAAGDCREIVRALDALAARQPGAQEELHGFLKNSTPLREAALRALGFIDRSDEHGLTAFDCLRRELHAECAAPPAQGTDLAQFRQQVAELLRREFDLETADPEDGRYDDGSGDASRVADKIAALIDQRDAAPGVRISQGTHDPSGVANG